METTHENSRFRSELLGKTRVLSINKLTKAKCKLSVISFTSLLASCQPSYASLHKNMERDYLVTEPKIQPSDVKKSHFTLNSSLLKIQEVDHFFNQPKIQPIDTQPLITIQNGNCKDSSQLEKINQLSFFDSFNCVDKVAVSGNNLLLSQSTSAAPQRQCGFFMSAIQQNGGIAPLCRVYTPKYDTRKGNMGSGTCTPRVKPDALTISTVSGVSQSSTR